ncbi:MAG: FG-GAP-like repeat-containing protein [Isosphaeraceae bacterium]|nr:FG-GAP-like repeat-containing protein [Isosphaeraceae bacterium]
MARRLYVLGLAAISSLAVAGYLLVAARHFRQGMDEAIVEMERGRFPSALRTLQRLDRLRPGRGEVQYRIGLCEQALGHTDEALRAWERVSPGDRLGGKAVVARGVLLANKLHLRAAEDVLEATLRREPSEDARRALSRLYRLEGRALDVRRLLQDGWETAADPVAVLRELWSLDTAPWPISGAEKVLSKADLKDDRIWLGKANLALLTGQFEAARQALAVCLRERPDDSAVCDARLALAQATNDTRMAREALGHLPASRFSADDELAFRAWWAARGSDRNNERRALEDLVARRPCDTRALERLAELALDAGDAVRASRYRASKVECDEIIERYRALVNEPEPLRRAKDLSEMAQALGRNFDARAWLTLALRLRPNDPVLAGGLERLKTPVAATNRGTLADRFVDLFARENHSAAVALRESTANLPTFSDDAETAGLRFFQDNGARSSYYLPEIMAGGVGLLDYDGDGWLDVYAVQGGPFPPNDSAPPPGDRLFRNQGDGSFADVTERSGIAKMRRGYGHGIAVGDFDNDGHPDVFVTRWHAYALYHNRGDGTFEDLTDAAGLGGDRDWPTSAAWADLDNDGDIDLYVCHYLAFDPQKPPNCVSSTNTSTQIYCDPMRFEACPDHLFRNDGDRFVDVTASAGILERKGRGLGVLAADFDDDGRVDLFVTNDMSANYLFRNMGDLRFQEVAHDVGVASNADGGYHAGMGIACGDLDGDGLVDLFVTNSFNEATTYYRNFGKGVFVDRTAASGLAVATRFLVGFGVATLDYDDDGTLDLISVNGNLNDARPYNPFPMPVQLLAGRPGGRLADVSSAAGPPWSELRLGRGLAVGDVDNDGRTDALVMSLNEPLAYFHNRTAGGRSVTLRLEGRSSNRDAVGARVTLRAGGRMQTAHRFGGGSYQSAADPRLHFGTGAATHVQSLEVRWPSGRVDRHRELEPGTEYLIREGEAAPIAVRHVRP